MPGNLGRQRGYRSLKSLFCSAEGMAAYAYHARVLGKTCREVDQFFYEALYHLGEDEPQDVLLPLVLKTGAVNLKCLELLDHANTEAYGDPVPTEVPLTIEKGPFIVVSGHDLHDMKLLLEQTDGKGVNIYTHSEMLPHTATRSLKSTRSSREISAPAGRISSRNSTISRLRCCSPRTA